MKRFLFLFLTSIMIVFLCVPASAHSGKTDAAGGHYDSSTGEYHYHHGYPAHSHAGGCPYGYDDKTDYSSGNNASSKDSSNGCSQIFTGEVIVILITFVLIAVVVFCIWLTHDSGSSSSNSKPVSKPTTPTKPIDPDFLIKATQEREAKLSKLESEVSGLKRENKDLRESIQYKDSLLKKQSQEISELQGTDAQRKITDLETKIMWLTHEKDTLQSRVSSLTKKHDQYEKEKEAEIKKLKSEATPVSQSELNRLQNRVIDQQLEIQRLQQLIDNSSKSQQRLSDLTERIAALNLINQTHEKTISSLKVELATARKATHAASAPAEEERRYFEEKIEKLKEELKEPTYFKNLFTSSLKKLEKEGDSLFYNYPSVHDFLRQVTDKRFHRAMIEDIAISGKITIEATIRSGDSTYKTTLQNCTCVDHQRTNAPCKHMLFLAYHAGVLLIHQEEAKKSIKTYLDNLQKTPVPKK